MKVTTCELMEVMMMKENEGMIGSGGSDKRIWWFCLGYGDLYFPIL